MLSPSTSVCGMSLTYPIRYMSTRPSSEILDSLIGRATLSLVEGADHSFHVPARTGRSDLEVRNALLQVLCAWMDSLL